MRTEDADEEPREVERLPLEVAAPQGWRPPWGAISVYESARSGLWVAGCARCGRSTLASKSEARHWAAEHACPAGTAGSFPRCPSCGAVGPACRRTGGQPARRWHPSRQRAYDVGVAAGVGG